MKHYRLYIIGSVFLILGFLYSLSHPAAIALTNNDYDNIVKSIDAPGIAIIEFDSHHITSERYFGVDGNGRPLHRDTPFVWGSLAKSLTATAALQLAREGKLNLTENISTYIPELRGSALDTNGATIEDLIHHTTGLPTNLAQGTTNAAELITELRHIHQLPTTRTFHYSNAGYAVLQLVIERVTKEPFSKVISEKVIEPAGSTPIISDLETFQVRVPRGHQKFFNIAKPSPVEAWPNAFGVAFLSGSSAQFATYGIWQLRHHQANNHPYDFPRVQVDDEREYGAGFNYKQMKTQNGSTVEYVYHSGSVWGYSSYLGFIPEENRGLIILTNELGIRTSYDEVRRNAARDFIAAYFGFGKQTYPDIFPADYLVLVGEALIIVLLAGAIVKSSLKWRHPRIPKDSRQAFQRTTIRLLVGVGGALVLFFSTPAISGYGINELNVGAPDIALLYWIILIEIHLLTAIVVVREITWSRKSHRAALTSVIP